MVKQLDHQMLRDISEPKATHAIEIPKPSFVCQSESEEVPPEEAFAPSLADICCDVVSRNLTIDSALKVFEDADAMLNEELKLNCMKFVALNVVSYLEQGPNFEKLLSLPVYLLRDLQNFIKVKND
jgi:hypothetical protein